jgi:hypothetical protein
MYVNSEPLLLLLLLPTAGSFLDEHLSSYLTAGGASRLPQHKYKNKANSAMVVLRGKESGRCPEQPASRH